MRRLRLFAGTVLTALVLSGPASSQEYHLIGAPEAYTLVNLHPDERQRVLYSVNYLREGLIPLCTRVRIDSVDPERMLFTLTESGRQYMWAFHRSLRDPIPKHLDRFFGKTCDKKKIESMSKLDQDGIAQGKVFPGMTKEGVILAIGYPPELRPLSRMPGDTGRAASTRSSSTSLTGRSHGSKTSKALAFQMPVVS